MSRRPAGCVVRRREDWPSCQVARRSRRAFWTSPHRFEFKTLGPALSVRIPSVRRLDRRPVCLLRHPCGLRTDRAGDACAELIRASLGFAGFFTPCRIPHGIWTEGLGESALVLVLRSFTRNGDIWAAQIDLLRALKERFDAEGISIPYPQPELTVMREPLPGQADG